MNKRGQVGTTDQTTKNILSNVLNIIEYVNNEGRGLQKVALLSSGSQRTRF